MTVRPATDTTSGTRSVTLRFPLPPRGVHQNGRGTMRQRARIIREYRELCRQEAAAQCGLPAAPFARPVVADLVFMFRQRRRRDAFNHAAACKPLWDGLVDAGLLVDDDWDHLVPGQVVQGIDPTLRRGYVLVRLTETGGVA